MADMNDLMSRLGGNAAPRELSPDDYGPDSAADQFEGLDLDDCFSQVDKVSKITSTIEDLCSKLPAVHSSIMTSMGSQKDDAMERHTALTNQVKDLYKTAMNGVKRLDMEVKAAESGPERFSAEFRIKKSQYSTLSRNLKRVMMEYNSVETKHREEMKNMTLRKLKTVGLNDKFSEDELEQMVESKDSVFTQDILVNTASKRKDLEEIDQRKEEILKLETNVLELHEMFYDMMLLVDDQGDLIDNIENNVERTTNYVSKGAQNTAIARKFKRKNTTLKWIICVVITIVIGVILVIVGVIIAAIVAIQGN